jgi:hypothetical protein
MDRRFGSNLAAPRGRTTRALVSGAYLPSRSTATAALRIALGVVYIWFGALKVAGVSAVNGLITATMPWPTPGWFIPAMGVVEIGIGAVFIWGRRLVLLLPLFVAHMAGTFSVLVMAPQMAYQHGNPLMLTMSGEFVVKNIVLVSAGVVVALSSDPLRPPQRTAAMPGGFDPEALEAAGLDRTVIRPNGTAPRPYQQAAADQAHGTVREPAGALTPEPAALEHTER